MKDSERSGGVATPRCSSYWEHNICVIISCDVFMTSLYIWNREHDHKPYKDCEICLEVNLVYSGLRV